MDRQNEYITEALAVQGGHLTIGRDGFSLHFKRGVKLSGYGSDEMKGRCVAHVALGDAPVTSTEGA